ncbi:CenpB-DNA-bind-domain-containing protein [Zopfia rhizophila CBS 207.26]|uniref:CenpB-DNA-bind-domain-containing protein n=1 Tax=Zopfia rhizophila CBS 207.26 TaxID=1314779 RepID=A0A6A6EIF1_9PEZI|nr:CenpB-DNA-bind-domain-containing protein [Zopfia rhizophila CBS 207.26]
MPPKAISDVERQALRAFYFSQKPQPKQKDIIAWFEQQYGRKLGQATISNSLKDCYKHLNNAPAASSISFRQRSGKWELLEKILFSWQQQLEARGQLVSGEVLQAKAKDLWVILPEYAGKPIPEFSPGWLGGFKKRFGIKQYT